MKRKYSKTVFHGPLPKFERCGRSECYACARREQKRVSEQKAYEKRNGRISDPEDLRSARTIPDERFEQETRRRIILDVYASEINRHAGF